MESKDPMSREERPHETLKLAQYVTPSGCPRHESPAAWSDLLLLDLLLTTQKPPSRLLQKIQTMAEKGGWGLRSGT